RLGKRCLCLDRALNGIDGAAELRQHAVPSGIGNPPATGGNQAVKDVSSLGQILEGTDLVGPHQAAVSLDVGCKNRDQPAFGIARFGQDAPSDRRLAYSASILSPIYYEIRETRAYWGPAG